MVQSHSLINTSETRAKRFKKTFIISIVSLLSIFIFNCHTFGETHEELSHIFVTREELANWGSVLYPQLDNMEINLVKAVQKEVRYQMYVRWMDKMVPDMSKKEWDEFRIYGVRCYYVFLNLFL